MPSPSENSRVSLFLTTRWTLVGDAACGEDSRAEEGLAQLFQIYWPPLYRYVRRSGRQEQDAEDLVQGFFLHLLEGKGLGSVDRERGRFRAFLLAALKNYLANEWRRDHRQKRGGLATHLSIDWRDAETGLCIEPPDDRSPDKHFDREWAIALLDKVLDDLANDEKDQDFARWKPFLSMSSDRISYTAIATEFGVSEGAARVAVHRLRKRYRQRLRDEITRTLATDDLVDEEMRALFAAVTGQ